MPSPANCCKQVAIHTVMFWHNVWQILPPVKITLATERPASFGSSRLVWVLFTEGVGDFFIGIVLAQGVDCPDGGRNPANQCNLQDEADDACNRATDGKEGQPR